MSQDVPQSREAAAEKQQRQQQEEPPREAPGRGASGRASTTIGVGVGVRNHDRHHGDRGRRGRAVARQIAGALAHGAVFGIRLPILTVTLVADVLMTEGVPMRALGVTVAWRLASLAH